MEEKEFYQRLWFLAYCLSLPQWPLKNITPEEATVFLANFFGLDPKDPNFLQQVLARLTEILAQEETPSIPQELKKLVKDYETHLNEIPPDQLETFSHIMNFYKKWYQELVLRLTQKGIPPSQAKAPFVRVVQEVQGKIPKTPSPKRFTEAVSPEEHQEIVAQTLSKVLPPEMASAASQVASEIATNTYYLAAEVAASPSFPSAPPPTPPPSEEIPPSVSAKLTPEPQGVAFKLVFALLHPPTTVSFIKKVIAAPIVKPIQLAVKIAPENVPEVVKKAILEGLTSKDIQASIKALQEAGLPPNHPKIALLKTQQERLEEFESSHKILAFFLRQYHEFSKKFGSRQIQEPETGLWLPRLSPSPAWAKEKGFSWQLREGLNRLGIFFRTHQWVPTPEGGKVIRFVLPDKIIRFLTFGKIENFAVFQRTVYKGLIRLFLIRLEKTFVGKIIKTVSQRLIIWVLKKPKLTISQQNIRQRKPSTVSFLKNFGSFTKRQVKKILEGSKKEAAKRKGNIFIIWGEKVTEKVTILLNQAALTIGNFFNSLTSVFSLPSSPNLSTTVILGGVAVVAILSLLSIITIRSAFIIPSQEISPPAPQYFQVIKTANPLIPVKGGTIVNYQITITSGTEKITKISVIDEINTTYLEKFSVNPPGVLTGNTITWPEFDLEGEGNSITFTYSAVAKSGVTEKTKISNLVTVSGEIVGGQTVTRKASVTLNSDGAEIVQRAKEIVNSLSPGFWRFWNRSSLYPELFDEEEFSLAPNHCVYRPGYPQGCQGEYSNLGATSLFWCTWLVIKSYNETGHPVPTNISSQAMAEWFKSEGKFLPFDTDISQIQPGDVLFLEVPQIEEGVAHHVAIISEVTPDYITTLDANSSSTTHTYTVSGGRVQNLPGLNIYGFGKP